ncbi:MAG: molybdopterin-dependent oxidoreductase [Thermodesulfobacteriota bacterium]
MKTTIQTYDPQCKSRCGVICHIEDGKLLKIRRDPDHPNTASLCPKGLASPELVYHPERLRYPLKRTRPKTDPDPGWERITWEEALDTIAQKLLRIRETHGAEAVVFGKGSSGGAPANDFKAWISRLGLAFGSPNYDHGTIHICSWHKSHGSRHTYGVSMPKPDLENTRCILLWGHNPAASWKKHLEDVAAARKRGAAIIIIDPRRNETWRKGDLWLPVRPGTDAALALGMLNVVISEKLYEREFVRQWTNAPLLVRADNGRFLRQNDIGPASAANPYLAWDETADALLAYDPATRTYLKKGIPALSGEYRLKLANGKTAACRPAFAHLTELVNRFTPEKASEITWVGADKIREAARLFFTTKPSCYYAYNGVEQHTGAMQNNRAICILFALSGNFDRPGGNVIFPKPKTNPIDGKKEFKPGKLPLGKDNRPLGPTNVQARDLYRAILEEKPYPVKALVSFSGNTLTANGDSLRGRAAFEKLEFFALSELFETPAAKMADILLPAATAWESFLLKPTFEGAGSTCCHLQLMPQVIKPLYESKPDTTIIFELAQKLGLSDKFWNGDIEAAFNYQLKPSGLTVADLRKQPGGISLPLPVKHEKHKEADGSGVKGFSTPTGRIEVYSEAFLDNGFDPLPVFKEPLMSPFSRPELARRFPFILTNAKLLAYCHGQHRGVPALRKLVPHPFVEIHPDTAEKLGINAGDWVKLSTPHGSIRVTAKLQEGIHPRVVSTQHGWWQGCKALNLPAYDPFNDTGANVNLIVTNDLADPITGAVPHKSYICNVEKLAGPGE